MAQAVKGCGYPPCSCMPNLSSGCSTSRETGASIDTTDLLSSASFSAGNADLTLGSKSKRGCLTRALLYALVMSPIYLLTGKKEDRAGEIYPIPTDLEVNHTTLPTKPISKVAQKIIDDGPKLVIETKADLDVSSADLSNNFEIVTDNYHIVKDEDLLPSRIIGSVFSCVGKILFWDSDYGAGLDEEEAKAVVAMLESNPELKDVYVRINHNAVFQDCARLFNDPKVVERNPLAARILVGLPTTFMGELFAEISRGDYYNPMTQTAVLYSNVRSISAHELGHHQDFQRFDSDWWYNLARAMPPVMLYQEWQASSNAKNNILAEEDQWQFNRYLIPAFITYLVASFVISKRMLQKASAKADVDPEEVNPVHVGRHWGTLNGSFAAGLKAGSYASTATLNPLIGAAAFLGTWMACKWTADQVLKRGVPYPHEEK